MVGKAADGLSKSHQEICVNGSGSVAADVHRLRRDEGKRVGSVPTGPAQTAGTCCQALPGGCEARQQPARPIFVLPLQQASLYCLAGSGLCSPSREQKCLHKSAVNQHIRTGNGKRDFVLLFIFLFYFYGYLLCLFEFASQGLLYDNVILLVTVREHNI